MFLKLIAAPKKICVQLPVDCAPEWSNGKQHRFANDRAKRDRTGISRDGLILLAAPSVLIATTGYRPVSGWDIDQRRDPRHTQGRFCPHQCTRYQRMEWKCRT